MDMESGERLPRPEHRSRLGKMLRTNGLDAPVQLPPAKLVANTKKNVQPRDPFIRDKGIIIDLTDKRVAEEGAAKLSDEIETALGANADVAGFMANTAAPDRQRQEHGTVQTIAHTHVDTETVKEPASGDDMPEEDGAGELIDVLAEDIYGEYEEPEPVVAEAATQTVMPPTQAPAQNTYQSPLKKPSRLKQIISRHKYTFRTNYNNVEPGDLVSPLAILLGGAKYVSHNRTYLPPQTQKIDRVNHPRQERVPRFGRKKLVGILGAVAAIGIGISTISVLRNDSPETLQSSSAGQESTTTTTIERASTSTSTVLQTQEQLQANPELDEALRLLTTTAQRNAFANLTRSVTEVPSLQDPVNFTIAVNFSDQLDQQRSQI